MSENLGHGFRELGVFMMELGLKLARRPFDSSRNWIGDKRKQVSGICSENLWQQWHYDNGIFTVLTAPIFRLVSLSEWNTYLQIFDPRKDNAFMVKASPESFIIQVVESADIISRGKLRATLRSVCRPSKFDNLSRETFVVFLQPAWNKTFSVTDYPMNMGTSSEIKQVDDPDQNKMTEEIQKIVPPLALRLKDGIIFADFSRETTKQYYGGSGLQSNIDCFVYLLP
ncbi:uncharacterized protein [Malus domestica]|uniref:uncharacterized protein n=1 Tax=Malus domestica TaxID=3750 RepID=UPI0010AA47A0|nr:uncharacterized protein LOC103449041 [Malus domestica]